MIPLAAISQHRPGHTPLSVNHQGLFVTSTISFNLQPGKSLGQAAEEINATIARIDMPASINGTLAGTAEIFRKSLSNEPILILAAIAAVYILLGVLYESYVHPITILSTLPSAGGGRVLTRGELYDAILKGAVERVRPKMMTVVIVGFNQFR